MSNRHLISLLCGILSCVFSIPVFAQPPCPESFIDSCAYVDNGVASIYFNNDSLIYLSSPIVISWNESNGGSGTDTTTVGAITDGGNPYNISGLEGNLVEVMVVSGNGCQGVCTVKPYEPPPPCTLDVMVKSFSNPTCQETQSGIISVTVASSNGEVRYQWGDTDDNVSERTGLAAGTYTLTVTDEEGCVGTLTKTLTLTGVIDFTLTTTPDFSNMEQPSTGSITITGDLNNPPYTITLVNQASQSTTFTTSTFPYTISQLTPQYYSVTVKDNAGCENTESEVLVGKSFVVPPHTLFVVEFDEDISTNDYQIIIDSIQTKAVRRDSCHCGKNGMPALQLWESGDEEIELFTSGEATTTKMRPDTSGLGNSLLENEWSFQKDSIIFIPCDASAPSSPNPLAIAIIDSGIALPNPGNGNRGHRELVDLYWANNFNATWRGPDCQYKGKYGYDFVTETGNVVDEINHGTLLAGIFKQSLPFDQSPIKIMNLKVCSPDPSYAYSLFDLICAIHYAVDSNAQVINLSLGYTGSTPSAPLYSALRRAEANDIPVVISAGNKGLDLNHVVTTERRWPVFFKTLKLDDGLSPMKNLLVVTSVDGSDRNILDPRYANFGTGFVDIATIGDFYTTMANGENGAFKGTSLSAAYASTLIAIAKSYKPNLKSFDIFNAFFNSGIKMPAEEGKMNHAMRINREGFFSALGIQDISFDWGATFQSSQLDVRRLWSNRVNPGQVAGAIVQNHGNPPDQVVASNISMIIKRYPVGGSPVVVFRKDYCATNILEWEVPLDITEGQYFMRAEINGIIIDSEMEIQVKRP